MTAMPSGTTTQSQVGLAPEAAAGPGDAGTGVACGWTEVDPGDAAAIVTVA
jgi:hypothetical protein